MKKVEFHDSSIDEYTAERATAGEPTFTMRADDPVWPMLLEVWAEIAKANGLPLREYRKAMKIAAKMREWRARRRPVTLRLAA